MQAAHVIGHRHSDFGESLGGLLDAGAANRPGGLAVVDSDACFDHAALAKRAEGLAAQLAELGIGRGDRAAIWLPNGVDYLAAIFAIARRGAIAVHVNTRLGAVEVGDLLGRTGARLVFTCSGFTQADFLQVLAAVPQDRIGRLETILCANAGSDTVCGVPVIQPDFTGQFEDIGRPDDACLIYATGGTTSKPKLVVHSQYSIAHHAHAVMRAIGTDRPGAAMLAAVPFCGTFGNVAAMAAIAGGATVVCMDRFEGDAADALIRRHHISHLVGDDRMMDRLATAALDRNAPYETVRFFGVAAFSADAMEALARGVEANLGPHAIYGSSEVQALFAIGLPENNGWGSVHPVDPAAEFMVDDVGGQDELAIHAPSLFDRYLDDEPASDRVFEKGWFRTGDRASRDGDAFLFEGRMGDALRLGGFLVSPLEIEAFLHGLPGVAAAQVVGVDGPRGSAAFAFVIADQDVDLVEAALIAECREMLARYKVPYRIVALDAFPCSMGPNGPKISRAELRRIAAEMIVAAADTSRGIA